MKYSVYILHMYCIEKDNKNPWVLFEITVHCRNNPATTTISLPLQQQQLLSVLLQC